MAVVQFGSIAKAAAALSVSHPVVSKAVADLEHVFGVNLIERKRQGVEPTIQGRACLDCGTAVLTNYAVAFREWSRYPIRKAARSGSALRSR
jgi:DNA-binding transcriptional LysR family regulator